MGVEEWGGQLELDCLFACGNLESDSGSCLRSWESSMRLEESALSVCSPCGVVCEGGEGQDILHTEKVSMGGGGSSESSLVQFCADGRVVCCGVGSRGGPLCAEGT